MPAVWSRHSKRAAQEHHLVRLQYLPEQAPELRGRTNFTGNRLAIERRAAAAALPDQDIP